MIGDAFLPPGQTTYINKVRPIALDSMALYQRLCAAGYTQDQADAVFGIKREVVKSCETCRHSHIYRNDPWCLSCSDNSRRADLQESRWEACHDSSCSEFWPNRWYKKEAEK